MFSNVTKLLLVGTGKMGKEYAKVLEALSIDYDVVGRGEENCRVFEEAYNRKVFRGGLELLDERRLNEYSTAIVASSVESLSSNVNHLLKTDIENILVEKPGALDPIELSDLVAKNGIEKFRIGYNRRFYSAVLKAEEIIEEDGGITSFFFDFTEWAHKIVDSPKSQELKRNWLWANSSHVIDLAFFMGGMPLSWSSFSSGELSWHPKSIFSGAGQTEKGTLFSYYSNWQSAGRWNLEINTSKRKLIFCPMESLDEILKGTIKRITCEYDDDLDQTYKPGLYLQVKSFLANDFSRLISFQDQLKHAEIYSKIIDGGIN